MDAIYAYVDGGYLRETAKELHPDQPWLEPFLLIDGCVVGALRHATILGTIHRF